MLENQTITNREAVISELQSLQDQINSGGGGSVGLSTVLATSNNTDGIDIILGSSKIYDDTEDFSIQVLDSRITLENPILTYGSTNKETPENIYKNKIVNAHVMATTDDVSPTTFYSLQNVEIYNFGGKRGAITINATIQCIKDEALNNNPTTYFTNITGCFGFREGISSYQVELTGTSSAYSFNDFGDAETKPTAYFETNGQHMLLKITGASASLNWTGKIEMIAAVK